MSTNVINLFDSKGKNANEVLINTIASRLKTTKENIFNAHLLVTSKLMAEVQDGYIMYMVGDTYRSALVVNMEVEGYKFPFIYHVDDGISSPVGLLYNSDSYEYIGDFIDYVCREENVYLYHELANHIPLELNAIGVIQGIEMAKRDNIRYTNELGIRRIAKDCIQMLKH